MPPRLLRWAATIAAATVLLNAAAAHAAGYAVDGVAPWKQNASPVGWSSSLNRVVYNSRGTNGLWNAYSANPDGSDPECLTCALPDYAGVGTGTNRGASDVSPDGEYMLATVEEPVHAGLIGAADTMPGAGADNNVWLYTTDGQHAWPLTDIAAAGQHSYGSLWPRFDRTGNEIVWASATEPALLNFGAWQLKVANIVWSGGVPSLSDIRTIDPVAGKFYEPYGFSPDDSNIVFASNAGELGVINDQIDTININGTGFTHLTSPDPSAIIDYSEFGWYAPNNQIIYSSSIYAASGGLDYWTMNGDGSDPQQLTYFNEPWNSESLGKSLAESLAFDPSDPNLFIAAVASDSSSEHVNAETVTLAPSNAGLTEQFYTGESFGKLLYSTTQNPADGLDAMWTSPAPGVPENDYSTKWTGTITPPSTGSYSFCVIADSSSSAYLYLNGQELIDGKHFYGRRGCATVAETAGSPVAIEMEYEHGIGPSHAQLSWIAPGGSGPTVVPAEVLSAAAPTLAPRAARRPRRYRDRG